MYPGMMGWWKYARSHRGECGGDEASCGPGGWHGHRGGGGWHGGHGGGDDDVGGSAFGVRRPLRFLAYKLELDDEQVATLARILDELKVERAQAEVDRRRTVGAFADALEGEAFDAGKATEGGELRVKSAQKLREAVVDALQKMHGVLRPDQRKQLAYLIRTGALLI
ncbi:MAG: Spy/CpxP family protein refolding chaperone [Deltaproteobacteria bacterium]|nr:Spy/CpxP family protein refolding chaperone [Deltaproteobacteria bacterium]